MFRNNSYETEPYLYSETLTHPTCSIESMRQHDLISEIISNINQI